MMKYRNKGSAASPFYPLDFFCVYDPLAMHEHGLRSLHRDREEYSLNTFSRKKRLLQTYKPGCA